MAIFGQTDISLTPSLVLTLGSRYTTEDKEAKIASFGECDGGNCDFTFQDDDSWSFISANVG